MGSYEAYVELMLDAVLLTLVALGAFTFVGFSVYWAGYALNWLLYWIKYG
jgi:hypothetical protein